MPPKIATPPKRNHESKLSGTQPAQSTAMPYTGQAKMTALRQANRLRYEARISGVEAREFSEDLQRRMAT